MVSLNLKHKSEDLLALAKKTGSKRYIFPKHINLSRKIGSKSAKFRTDAENRTDHAVAGPVSAEEPREEASVITDDVQSCSSVADKEKDKEVADNCCHDIEKTKSTPYLVKGEHDEEKDSKVSEGVRENEETESLSIANEETDVEVPDTSCSDSDVEDIPAGEIDRTARIWTLATLFAKAKEATCTTGKSKNTTKEEGPKNNYDESSTQRSPSDNDKKDDSTSGSLSIYSGEKNKLISDLDMDINDNIVYLKPESQIDSYNQCSIDEESLCSRYNVPMGSIEVVDEEALLIQQALPSSGSTTNKKTKTTKSVLDDTSDADSVCFQYSHANKSLKSLTSFDTLNSKQSSKGGRYVPSDLVRRTKKKNSQIKKKQAVI